MAGAMMKKGSANANAAKAPAPGAVAKEVAKEKKVGVSRPVLGIGKVARELIAEGKTNEEVLAAVLKKFPTASTKIASIAWYRNDMIKKGEKGVKHQSEVKEGLRAKEVKETKAEAKAAKGKAKEDAAGLA